MKLQQALFLGGEILGPARNYTASCSSSNSFFCPKKTKLIQLSSGIEPGSWIHKGSTVHYHCVTEVKEGKFQWLEEGLGYGQNERTLVTVVRPCDGGDKDLIEGPILELKGLSRPKLTWGRQMTVKLDR